MNLDSLELARAVWQLGSKLVISTNFDRTLQWAAPAPSDLQTWEIEAKAPMTGILDSVNRFTAWHLHGHIQNPTDLVLTPDGYDILYGSINAESRYQAAIQSFRQLLTSRTLLFVGFSGDDAHVSAQLRRVNEIFAGSNGPHYILVKSGANSHLNASGIPLEQVEFSDYGTPLLDLIRELGIHSADGAPPRTDPNSQSSKSAVLKPELAEVPATQTTQETSVRRSIGDLTAVHDFDSVLVAEYRQQLRLDALATYPKTLTDVEFLERTPESVTRQQPDCGKLLM